MINGDQDAVVKPENCWAHNPKVVGSSPTPATNTKRPGNVEFPGLLRSQPNFAARHRWHTNGTSQTASPRIGPGTWLVLLTESVALLTVAGAEVDF